VVGSFVGLSATYVGSNVGNNDGIVVGAAEGCGVGFPGKNVGSNDGGKV